ncbi:putative modification methylase [Streptomyces lydicamycinicus]|uniref:DNA (cytosine-5-)-methyltransferase n=2 Tax=Streptomyces lydicamycinicus TaxID=1546107 RepID=A0A0P4R9H9_9ACTN|nr:putative modification methylase [Streptomyces lydicamycinicus]
MGALRIGSVCTGYGGLDMAVQAVFGGELAWVADNDPGASRILAHRHPGVPNLGDITTADFSRVAAVDVVCGGYPCQPFSSAGKRKGTADARHIWPHIARALGVLRPRYAVFENVAGHLSLGFDAVLADLAALGFDARWCTLRASDVGAAHQRNRLFVVAWPADTGGEGLAGRRAAGAAPDRRRLAPADPVDLGEHRTRARGTGRDEPAARRLPAAHPARVGEREPADAAHTVTGSGHSRQVPGGGDGQPADLGDLDWREYGPAIARWEADLGRPAPGPVDAVGRLSPVFVEWLMGLPAGHVTAVPGLSRSAQLKALGNGVVPHQAVAALRFLAPTLSARAAA